MLWLLIATSISAQSSICICKVIGCSDMCNAKQRLYTDIEDYSDQFYEDLRNYMGQARDIVIYIIDKSYSSTYTPEISLSVFIDRNVSFILKNINNMPKMVTLTYSEYDDFSSTDISFHSIPITLKCVDCEKDSINLTTKSFGFYRYVNSETVPSFELIPSKLSTIYSLTTESLVGLSNSIVEFDFINVTSEMPLIFNISVGVMELDISEKEILCIYNNNQNVTLYIQLGITILISGSYPFQLYQPENNIILNFNVRSILYMPLVLISTIKYVTIDGVIPLSDEPKLFIFSNDISSYLLYLNIIAYEVPIFVNATAVRMSFNNNCILKGSIVTPTAYLSINSTEMLQNSKVNVTLTYVNATKICTRDARIDLFINTFEIIQTVGNNVVPIEVSINEYSLSKVSVENFVTTIRNSYKSLTIYSSIERVREDKDLGYILDGTNDVLKLPKDNWNNKGEINIKYSSDVSTISAGIHGFSDATNCLSCNLIIIGSEMIFQITAVSPSILPLTLCYPSYWCASFDGLALTDEMIEDLSKCEYISTITHNYLINLRNGNIKIGFHNLQLEGLTFKFTDSNFYMAPGDQRVTVSINPPKNPNIISELFFQYVKISSTNFSNIGRVILNRTYYDSNDIVIKVENTSIVEIDPASLVVMEKCNNIPNLTIKLDSSLIQADISIGEIYITNPNQFLINYSIVSGGNQFRNLTFTRSKAANLTIISGDLTLHYDTQNNNHESFNGFNLVFNQESYWKIYGDFTTITSIDNGMNVWHDINKLSVHLSQGFIHPDIHFMDLKSEIDFYSEYGDPKVICIFNVDDSQCSSYSLSLNETEINSYSKDIKEYSIKLVIAGYEEEKLLINLEPFDCCSVEFASINNNKQKIMLSYPTNGINTRLTAFLFDNMNISIHSDSPENMSFGKLNLTNSVFDKSVSSYTINVSYLDCVYEDMLHWKNIYIKKGLQLKGALTQEEYSVNMIESELNELNLFLHLESDSSIICGDGFIKVGNGYFYLNNSDKNLIIVTCNTSVKIAMNYIGDVEKNNIPSIEFLNSTDCELIFIGTWPLFNDVFNIIRPDDLVMKISNIVPLKIISPKSITILAETATCGITGNIVYTDKAIVKISIDLENDISREIHFLISQGFKLMKIIKEPLIIIDSCSILVIVNQIINEMEEIQTYSFQFKLQMNGIPALRIENKLENGKLDKVLRIESSLTGHLQIQSLYRVLNENMSILTASKQDLEQKFEIKYVNSGEDATHGFGTYWNCLALEEARNSNIYYSTIYVYPYVMPSDMPIYAQYDPKGEFMNNIEIKIKDPKYFLTISTLFLNRIKNIFLYISDDLNTSYPIRLSTFDDSFSNISFTIDGRVLNGRNISLDIGSGISKLILLSVNVIPIDPSIITTIDKLIMLNMTDAMFSCANTKLGNNISYLDTDVDSLASILCTERSSEIYNFTHPTNIRQTNFITFSENGWILQEEHFKRKLYLLKSQFISSLSFEVHNPFTLSVSKPNVMTSIYGTKIFAYPDMKDGMISITFEDGWSKISEYEGLEIIKSNEYVMYLMTISYPLPSIFTSSPNSLIVFESFRQNVIYHLNETFMINQTVEVDMTRASEAQRHLKGDLIVASSSAKFMFINGIGDLDINEIVVNPDARAELPSTNIKDEITMYHNSFMYIDIPNVENNLRINLHWTRNLVPSLTLMSEVDWIPDDIIIILDDANPDFYSYNNILFKTKFDLAKGNFECQSWKDNTRFFSKISYFATGNDLIFQLSCSKDMNSSVLSMVATKNLPLPDNGDAANPNGSKGLPVATVAAIAIGCVVSGCLCVGIIVYCITRKQFEQMRTSNQMRRKRRFGDDERPNNGTDSTETKEYSDPNNIFSTAPVVDEVQLFELASLEDELSQTNDTEGI